MIIDLPTDRVMPDEDRLRNSDLIRRYVRQELLGADLEAFELALFDDPTLVQQVQVELAWYRGERTAAVSTQSAATPLPKPRDRASGWIPPRWAMAAGLVLGLGVGSGVMMLRPAKPALQQATMLSLSAVRGAESSGQFHVAAEQPVVLRYLARSPVPHAMEILDASGTRVDRQSDLRPDDHGWLVIIGPALSPAAGPYQVQIRTDASTERFQVVVDGD